MKKKFKIHTLGCRTNKYESQAYFDQLIKLGCEYSEDCADIHIINTCFVTGSAEKASKVKVDELLSKEDGSMVVITGCGADIFKYYKSDRVLVVPNLNKEQLVSFLCDKMIIQIKQAALNPVPMKDVLTSEDLSEVVSSTVAPSTVAPSTAAPPFRISNFYNQTRAFIKIQDGCNNFCTYCVIPFVRGRSRSRPISDIIEEVSGLVNNDFKEVVLTGINIGDYNFEGKALSDLVAALDEIEGLYRIRLSSIDPDKVDENLLKVIFEGKKTCRSLHISLQSGSDKILKKMNRNYSSKDFLSLVDKIKSRDHKSNDLKSEESDFTFTTDIIVGFPGEEDRDFEESLNLVKRVGFAKVHMFPFSRRKGTLADKFPFQVQRDIINKRKKILMEHAEQAAFDLREKYIGKRVKVLLEQKTFEDRYIFGHLDNFLSVRVDLRSLDKNRRKQDKNEDSEEKKTLNKAFICKELKINNSIVDVKITSNLKDSLSGEFL